MSGQNAVGFSFQPDIANTASLTHLLTGRALKALSDGGVDFYAVAATIFLGKQIPVRKSLESTVHAHIASRGGIQSFLCKALSIGWNERATSHWGSSCWVVTLHGCPVSVRFLALFGCEADQLPNVDVLKGMVSYLAPFLYDLGFSKVLQYVTTISRRKLPMGSPDFDEVVPHPSELSLTSLGDAQELAGAIKELIQTQQRDERFYLATKIRGAWLAAFASHILGMSVDLCANELVLWSSGGAQGHVTIEIDPDSLTTKLTTIRQLQYENIALAKAPVTEEARSEVDVTYPLTGALEALLAEDGIMEPTLIADIRRAIARAALDIFRDPPKGFSDLSMVFRKPSAAPVGFASLASEGVLMDVLTALNITDGDDMSNHKIREEYTREYRYIRDDMRPHHFPYAVEALGYLGDGASQRLTDFVHNNGPPNYHSRIANQRCSRSDFKDWSQRCRCFKLGGLICAFATTAFALTQSCFNAAELQVRGKALTGQTTSALVRLCFKPRELYYFEPEPITQILSHLRLLLSSDDLDNMPKQALPAGSNVKDTQILALSGGAYTVYCRCVLEQDCYDEDGRLIAIEHCGHKCGVS